jgi:hypothetical protein
MHELLNNSTPIRNEIEYFNKQQQFYDESINQEFTTKLETIMGEKIEEVSTSTSFNSCISPHC